MIYQTIRTDWEKGKLASLCRDGKEMLAENQDPLFTLHLRNRQGEALTLDAAQGRCTVTEESRLTTAQYAGFPLDLSVTVILKTISDGWIWNISVDNRTDLALESVDFPGLTMAGPLKAQGGEASVLWPYNEGALVEDGKGKDYLLPTDYPSMGNYAMFPNMVFAQFMLYLAEGGGLYMGLEDPGRGLKSIDFRSHPNGIIFRNRIFCGGDFGSSWDCGFDIVWRFFEGDWMDGAELYRQWFEKNLPEGLVPIPENRNLPAWYRDLPLVVTYPVRGIHDMDKMDPNGLFPYSSALPYLDEIADEADSRLLVLLMHWEGTAPWAPPYVWPPYGGEEMFFGFRDALHDRGHLLGVYCSGLGWTEQSNLIAEYNTEKIFRDNHLEEAMCLAPDGTLPKSKICTGQRRGYDLCPATEKAQNILTEALTPLFASGVDYVQALDQNHGGGMYLCYGRDHGHAPTPGPWMTETMVETLHGWKKNFPNGLLGCESASAEPFLPSLGLSDNRFELNYSHGRPVPLYAYLYHKYLYNFMGNQVCCPFAYNTDGLCYRMAYAAAAGDLLTLVINDRGAIEFCWGMRDFSHVSDKKALLTFCRNWKHWQNAYPDYFTAGRMIRPMAYNCMTMDLAMKDSDAVFTEKAVLSSAWQTEAGKCGQFFLNYTAEEVTCHVKLDRIVTCRTAPGETESDVHFGDTMELTVPAYGMCLLEWDA